MDSDPATKGDVIACTVILIITMGIFTVTIAFGIGRTMKRHEERFDRIEQRLPR